MICGICKFEIDKESCPNCAVDYKAITKETVGEILKERGNRYGEFTEQANISQCLKKCIDDEVSSYPDYMKESLEMILHKVARIANGDPYYIDSWKDIAGYAQLVVNELEKQDER